MPYQEMKPGWIILEQRRDGAMVPIGIGIDKERAQERAGTPRPLVVGGIDAPLRFVLGGYIFASEDVRSNAE